VAGIKRVSPPDRGRAERALAEFLDALGFDPKSPELAETPARAVLAFTSELLAGYDLDAAELLREGSEPAAPDLDPIVVRGIRVAAVCPHHLLVAEGTADVGYHPGSTLIGLGTLTRLVSLMAARLVFQEQIASDVVSALMTHGGASGAYCRVELHHACLRVRGAQEHDASVASFASAGSFRAPAFLDAILGTKGAEVR